MDLIKYDMTDIWAVAGDVVAPDSAKVRAGWGVEVVPRQWWNWFENRQDQNIAYLLQKSFAEWDSTTEYIINKSYVQRNGVVYKATATSTNSDPIALTSWVKAFVDSTPYLEAIKALAVTPNTQFYIDGSGLAQNAASSSFGRQIGNVTDAAAARTLIAAQVSNANLTGLSSVSGASNNLPYFTGSGNMAVTTFTGFARSLLDDADAAAMRATLSVYSIAEVDAALSGGLATKQPLDATLTALAGVASIANTLPYFTDVDTATVTSLTAYGRSLIATADASAARTLLSVDSSATVAANLTAGLATRQPLDATLTALAGLATGVNQLPYATGTDTFAQTTLTAFARTILDDADAVTVRGTIGANDAANLTTGLIDLARLPATLTGKNAATATALETARTIQGVSFNGTANITLSVVDKDSGVGSATLPAGTTAQRTASPVNGQLRYNSDNNEFEGYINGSWGGIGGGTPLFTVLWWPSRTAIPAGYVPADGQLLTRTTYSAAWDRVNVGDVPLVSDATWLANSTNRGAYSSGNGTTTFRIPDLNGKAVGTLAAPFLRGDGTNSAGTAGVIQGSALQDHAHLMYPDGTVSINTAATIGGAGSASYTVTGNGPGLGTKTSLVITTGPNAANIATETRPTNVTGVFIIKLIGGASDLTQEDASVAVAALENKLAYVSGRNRIINGCANIAQRSAATFSSGVGGYGGPDRYVATNGVAGGSFTQSVSTMVDGGVTKNCVLQTVNTVMTDYAGTKYWSGVQQRVEGHNSFDLKGKPVVVSFLFRASTTGTYTVSITDNTASQSYVTTFAATANTVAKIVVKVPTIPLTTNIPQNTGIGLVVSIGALNGGTYQTSTLSAWQSGNFLSATGATNWALTAGATIAVTELQLEAGTEPTAYEHKTYSEDIINCQRYYQTGVSTVGGYSQTGVSNIAPVRFGVAMRSNPTLTYTGSQTNCTVYDVRDANTQGFTVYTIAGNGGYIWAPSWTADAEL